MKRRDFVALSALPVLARGIEAEAQSSAAPAGAGGMFVSMHEATSADHDFRTAMEGYARAGVRAVEVDLVKVREFVGTGSPEKARRFLAR